MIKGCVQLKCHPYLEWEEKCASVDFCAKAIVYVGRKSDSIGNNHHLVHHEAFKWSDMFQWIIEYGFELDSCVYEEWTKKLSSLGEAGKSNAMYALLPLLNEANGAAAVMPTFDCTNVLAHTEDGGFGCPKTDEALMKLYLDFFVQSGFLELRDAGLETIGEEDEIQMEMD